MKPSKPRNLSHRSDTSLPASGRLALLLALPITVAAALAASRPQTEVHKPAAQKTVAVKPAAHKTAAHKAAAQKAAATKATTVGGPHLRMQPSLVAGPSVEQGFHATGSPLVEERSVPAAPDAGASQGSQIYLQPGAKRPAFSHELGALDAPRIFKGTSPAGGVIAHVSPRQFPFMKASETKGGAVALDCVPAGTTNQAGNAVQPEPRH